MSHQIAFPAGIPRGSVWAHRHGLLSVTFTGVDEFTDLDNLALLAKGCPATEWGVLYSHVKAGKGRYPSLPWIREFITQKPESVRCALHLCGRAAHDWIAGDASLRALAIGFNRLQLNVFGPKTNMVALRVALVTGAHEAVITQHHAINADLTLALQGLSNHAVLFDGSGGRGQLPAQWPTPLPGVAGGYAGGLGPSTMAEQSVAIAIAAKNQPYWMDMEQAIRDDQDRFNLDRVQEVLNVLKSF